MLYPILVILGTLGLLGGLLAGLAVLTRRWHLPGESVRKALHVLMALAMLPLPYVLPDLRAVWALALAATGAMLAVRYVRALHTRVGCVVYGIERQSWGDLCFPFGIALVYSLTRGDVLVYEVAVAALAFGDPAAAIVGGRSRDVVSVPGGRASVRGTLACAGVVLVLALVVGVAPGLAVALAGTVALVEAATGWGLDNVTLPLAVGVVLVGPAWLALTMLLLAGGVLLGSAMQVSAASEVARRSEVRFQP